MLSKAQVAEMIAKPHMLSEPSFPKGDHLKGFSQMMVAAIYHKSGFPVDPAQWKSGGDDDVFSILDASRMIALFAFDLSGREDTRPERRERFLRRASGSEEHSESGLVQYSQAAGSIIALVQTGKAVPGQYEVCDRRLIAWHIATLRPRTPS